MKTVNGKTMGFGFSAVNAGQRNVSVEPQLIAVSTDGGFRLTPPVTRALGVGSGEYVMFISNIDGIEQAIAAKDPQIVEFCQEQGLELGSPEASIAIHQEFDMWAIAKGVQEFDAKGNTKTTQERLSKKDKLKFVSQHFEEMLVAANEQADDETKDALNRDGITKEEQMDLLTAFVKARELPKYKGSKTANPAGYTGAGTSLTFTDTNVWNQLKADMEEPSKLNRVFDIDLDAVQDIEINNGYEMVTVKAFILGDHVDKEPSRIEKGDKE